jgi:DnaJ-class molecular chaperone
MTKKPMVEPSANRCQKLEVENKLLKEKLERALTKKPCWHCNGTGEVWTYWDGDTWCRDCHGTGML